MATTYASKHLSLAAAALVVGGITMLAVSLGSTARAATTTVDLGTSEQFAVLAGAGITNNASTTIQTEDADIRGDLGIFPLGTVTGGASISWLPPATGSLHEADAVAQQAQADNLIAYNAAASAASTGSSGAQLDGQTFRPGVYTASAALSLAPNGTVTFDAQGDPDAEFIIQVDSSLTMGTNSTVTLVNGAQACHLFWQVSDGATIGANATFIGTLLAESAIVAESGAQFIGRLLAQDASVTLNNNTLTMPGCTPLLTPPTTTTPPTPPITTTTPPPPATTTTPPPPATALGGGGSDTDNTPGLPDTGGSLRALLPIGMATLMAGMAVIVLARRRRRRPTHSAER